MQDPNLPYQTLHCHSTVSDGKFSPAEVLDQCKKNNIGVVAFTDHDSVQTAKDIAKLKRLNHQVRFISGIEMSALVVKEVLGNITLFHVTGLFVDPTNQKLLDYCKLAKEMKIQRAKKMIANLKSLGFQVELADVEKYTQGESMNRPHVVSAIVEKEENLKIIDQIVDKLIEDSKTDESLIPLVSEINGRPAYDRKCYPLFLDDRSYLKGIYVPYLLQLSMDEAVSLIRGAGGIALLAHWSYYKNKLNPDILEKLCQEKRIDGIETIYALGLYKSAFNAPQEKKDEFLSDMEFAKHLSEKYSLVEGGGGDFHTAEEFAFMIDPGVSHLAERTKKLVENILHKHPELDLSWTSLISP